jgi:hypothetical protein
MIAELNDNLESVKETKRRGRKKSENVSKSLGIFDHIKHIRTVQDPDYYKNLSEQDRKSFSPFMIIRGLSMNPQIIDNAAFLYKYFDQIPHEQFYTLLINGFVPLEHPKTFHPWVKGKKLPVSKKLIELISRYFEISNTEATEYGVLLSQTKNGRKELAEFCRDYGLNEKETEEALEMEEQ